MKLVDQAVGAEGHLNIDLVNGAIVVKGSEVTPGATISLEGSVSLSYLVEAGAAKSGSPLMQGILAIVDGALKAIA